MYELLLNREFVDFVYEIITRANCLSLLGNSLAIPLSKILSTFYAVPYLEIHLDYIGSNVMLSMGGNVTLDPPTRVIL
ncbi:hypothetical protein OUZ56_027512 [Daphnia magna]|uniref:Uncharacterized protein n=1 Tax=Daphnia magna TaxID=35525 RepID=A0ABQ9ZQN0_9CRUS|nr:hypothetical protein OUZ56_027512 [Daphnia magna]